MQRATPKPDADLEWAEPIIQAEVRVFVRSSSAFNADDEDELANGCLAHWWRQRHQYNAERGANRRTFLKRVTVNKLRDLHRRALRTVRETSLDRASPTGGPLHQRLSSSDVPPAEVAEQTELRERVQLTVAALAPKDRRVAKAIMETRSMTEAARRLAVSRPSLYRSESRIRKVFSDAGLDGFLD